MATTSLGAVNWFETTLSSGCSDTDLTINVNSTSGLPNEGFLVIEPDNTSTREVIYYTSKTSTTVVCPSGGRGYDGSSASSHSSGATVRMTIVSAYWEALQDGTAIATDAIKTTKIEDGAVQPKKLQSGTGTSWTYQSWTPTWTNLTIGNGTVTARYTQIGKHVECRLGVVFGTTTSFTGSPLSFSLPVTSIAYTGVATTQSIGQWRGFDTSPPTSALGRVFWNSTTTALIQVENAASTYLAVSDVSSTVPWTWAAGDEFYATFRYEAA